MKKCRKCKKDKLRGEGSEILNPANGTWVFLCDECNPQAPKKDKPVQESIGSILNEAKQATDIMEMDWRAGVAAGAIGLSTLLGAPETGTSKPAATQEREQSASMDLPQWEQDIIAEVADEYQLKDDARLLLYVIRKIENGGPGIEFGVVDPQARRYKGQKERSFRLQAQWAAGTIDKRYTGDLKAFARRWAPIGAKNDPDNLNQHWYPNAKFYLDRWDLPEKASKP